MGGLYAGLLGLILGAFLTGAPLIWRLLKSDKRLSELELQLFNAWKDGYVIPPAPSQVPEEEVLPDLPPDLQRLVNDWESADTKAELSLSFRRALADGFGVKAITAKYLDGVYGAPATPE